MVSRCDKAASRVDAEIRQPKPRGRAAKLTGMKILFDQGPPAPLRQTLAGPSVATAFEKAWSVLENGDLIRTAEADGFNALITTDKNLKHQQDLRGLNLAILVLPTTSWPKQAASGINARVLRIQPGMDWTPQVLRRKACTLPRPLGEQRWQRQLLRLESCCSGPVRI